MSDDRQTPGGREGKGSYTQRPARPEPERVTRDEDQERVERSPDAEREEAERDAGGEAGR